MKILIAAIISALALGGAGFNLAPGATGGRAPAPGMEICVAGMSAAFGGERAVTLSMAHDGQCGCPAACSAATLRFAGITLRI